MDDSVEEYRLEWHGRYSHSRGYVEGLLARVGLTGHCGGRIEDGGREAGRGPGSTRREGRDRAAIVGKNRPGRPRSSRRSPMAQSRVVTSPIRVLAAFLLIAATAASPLGADADAASVSLRSHLALQALDRYLETWNSRDPKRWAASLQYPHIRPGPGAFELSNTPEQYAAESTSPPR